MRYDDACQSLINPDTLVYSLIASDLDGTLLDHQHAVDTYTIETLQQLHAQGVHLVIATGRHYLDVVGIRSTTGVRAHLITSNGARIHDPDNQLIYSRNINPERVRELSSPRFTEDCQLHFYTDTSWLANQSADHLLAMHHASGFHYKISDLTRHNGEGVAKVLYTGPNAHLLAVEASLHAQFGASLTITFSAHDCLEVMAPGVTKGSALTFVLARMGLSAEHCLAFGDGQNDIEMLETVGHPCIMANAQARLLEQLPTAQRIGSNRESGVARHLRTVFQLDGKLLGKR